ncbi:SRPBCC family protein [Streptomyces sp. NPDC005963]|uniref:SRPBCC family protein n=1 Tax=Streptomyces sp. NPDC005963 TaxID=3156721 RepID=UPI00340751B9
MARKKEEPDAPEESAADRLKEELAKFASAQVQKLVDKAGGKLTDVTEQLSGIVENGGVLPGAGARILQGDSPVKALVSEKAKGVKDTVVDKAKDTFGGGKDKGKGKGKSGGGKSMNIVEVLDVGVPLRTAYDAWTQYEEFSSFAKGVQDVSKSEETLSDWKVKIGPSARSFKATVQEQVPDDRIVWTSEGPKGTTRGAVSFHELAPSLTRIVLVVEYYPSGFFEKTGNLWRVQGRRIRLDFKHFQRYVTLSEDEPEGWRGEIRDGEVVVSHEDAVAEEESEDEQEPDEGDEPEDESEDEEYDDEAYEDGDEDEEPEEDGDEDEYEDEYEDDEGDEESDEPEDDESDDDEEEEEPDEEEPPARRRRGRRASR